MEREFYMGEALDLALECLSEGEVPVGCVIVDEKGEIIGRGRNRREEKNSAIAHAEVEAITEACQRRGSWRLNGCSLYVTLEPCAMCAGAILNARLDRVYYGAAEEKTGCCGSVVNLFAEDFPYSCKVYGGVMAQASRKLLGKFFEGKRDLTQL